MVIGDNFFESISGVWAFDWGLAYVLRVGVFLIYKIDAIVEYSPIDWTLFDGL